MLTYLNLESTPKSSYDTCHKGSILNEKGMDDFEQFWVLKKMCQLMCQNCEETALFSGGFSSRRNNDEGLSRRKLRVRVLSTPHPKASVNSGAFLVVRRDVMSSLSGGYLCGYIFYIQDTLLLDQHELLCFHIFTSKHLYKVHTA